MASRIDWRRAGQLFYLHMYSMCKALAEVLGMVQGVAMESYARTLLGLGGNMGFSFKSVEEYISSLRQMGLVGGCRLDRLPGGRAEFIVGRCALAPSIHRALGMEGYSGCLCPLAAIAMVVLAQERGWKPGKRFFDYVKFYRKLSYFTEDGSRTLFEIPSKALEAARGDFLDTLPTTGTSRGGE